MRFSPVSGRFLPVFLCSFALLASLTGCGGTTAAPLTGLGSGGSGTTVDNFTVSSVQPASGATGVATTSTVQVTFSEAADSSTVSATTVQLTAASKPVTGTVTYDSSANTATLTPAAALAASTAYTVTVSGVKDAKGTAVSSFTSSFTTAAPPSSPATQYEAPIFNSALTGVVGELSIDTQGNVTVQMTGAKASSTFPLQFCPATNPVIDPNGGACMSLGNVTTDASGKADATVQFPKPGNWAGDFTLSAGGLTQYQTWLSATASAQTYQSILVPASTVNGTGIATTTQDPLTSGTITYAKGSVTFTVKGASPNTGYETDESETTYLGGSGTYALSTFNTDSNGDGTSTTTLSATGGDMLRDVRNGGTEAGFIGGFTVPQ